MKEYRVMVGGNVKSVHATREEAENQLHLWRNSWLAMVHPIDTMFVKEVIK